MIRADLRLDKSVLVAMSVSGRIRDDENFDDAQNSKTVRSIAAHCKTVCKTENKSAIVDSCIHSEKYINWWAKEDRSQNSEKWAITREYT